jgi:sugar/nucleoside kinase (ribokinase family)
VIVCTFGDLVLDVVAQLERPLVPGDDAPARTAVGPGGQAANVAAWCAELGARSRLVCKRADDDAGELVSAELRRRGVDVGGPVAAGRTGVVISIAETGSERTMASDRGVGSTLAVDELDADWFACDALHVSGYSLLEEDMAAAAAHAARAARASGARISVDVATWSAIGALGGDRFRSRLEALEPDLVFGGERELDEVGELEANVEVVRKLGAEGVVVGGRVYEPKPGRVVDSTGAGDALAAGFLVGGIELGLEAAARCVAKLGTMP